MNNWLLTLLIDSARASVCGRQVGECRYFKPVLSIALNGGGEAAGNQASTSEPSRGRASRDRTAKAEEQAGERSGGRLYLIAVLSKSGAFVFVTRADLLIGCPAEKVLPAIERCTVESIDQPRGDRVMRLQFAAKKGTAPRGSNFSLLLTLYGREGSAVIYDGDEPLDGVQRPNSRAGIPRPALAPPFSTISETVLCSMLRSDAGVPGLDQRLRKMFAGDSPEQAAAKLISFRDSVSSGARRIHVLAAGNPADAAPVPEPAGDAGQADGISGPFADVLSAAETIGRALVESELAKRIADGLKPAGSFIAKKRSLLEKLLAEHQAAAQHDGLRKRAETLAAYQSLVPPGTSTIELPDPYGSGKPIVIELDPAHPIHAQVQKLFKKASKLKRSLRFLQMKIEHLQALIGDLERRRDTIAADKNVTHALDALEKLRMEYQIPVRTHGRAAAGPAEKTYRRFDLGPMWFVFVGRNNRENDELTFRAAAPSDYWMHAQQAAGSHVILKSKGGKGNPSEAVLEAAAGIAAYYSKAKHSSIVPVICTLRKYVRKPRKAKPGAVHCSQVKTIFAEPRLPDKQDK
ncbi:MAG: DUF814 domain-containing protein [Chitinivibrionia bacterium]|nr:DUF814 domain-containing protein [Chitinivibrionia bacterium]